MTNTRILIVDDEVEAGEILCLRLSRHGMKAEYVSSGQDALNYLADHTVDVMLLDMKMPGMDGLEVLQQVREQYPYIAVIIISGHAHMDDAAKGLEMGAFFYLLKPIEYDVLRHKIEDAVTQAKLTKPE